MPKANSKKTARHDPLHIEMSADGQVRAKGRSKYAERDERRMNKERNEGYVDPKTSQRLMQIAREQQEEMEEEEEGNGNGSAREDYADFPNDDANGIDEESDAEADSDENEEYEYEEVELEGEDAEIFEKFMPAAPRERQNLADIIMAKIKEHDAKKPTDKKKKADGSEGRPAPPGIDPKVVQVYTKIGELLKRYRSGPVPKAFKVIPSIRNWEEVMYLTNPDTWTPHAVYQATRIFVSNMKPKQAQKFLNLVLLDHVRDDIATNKKLNYHLYMALKKALYKPAAFFKGILFPMCDAGTCTLREAVIIGSVLAKVSVPMLHSAAALFQLAEMEYSGPTSVFIRILLDKKYALPYRVVDSIVFHFMRFKQVKEKLPVLWHQSLLVFVQRYKADLTPEQKDALMGVLRAHHHDSITDEIRRELVHSVCRGEMIVPQDGMDVDVTA